MLQIYQFGRWGPAVLTGAFLLAGCPAPGDPQDDSATDTDPEPPGKVTEDPEPTTTAEPPSSTSDAPDTSSGPDDSTTGTSIGVDPSTGTDGTSTSTDGTSTTDASSTGGPDDPSTSSTSSTSTGGDDTGTTSTTGPSVPPPGGAPLGKSMTETVNSGTEATSTNFRMVFTLGQPAQTQGTYQSSNFRLHGGLIGANGEQP